MKRTAAGWRIVRHELDVRGTQSTGA